MVEYVRFFCGCVSSAKCFSVHTQEEHAEEGNCGEDEQEVKCKIFGGNNAHLIITFLQDIYVSLLPRCDSLLKNSITI